MFDNLTNEQAGELIKAIFEYEATGSFSELSPIVKIATIPIRQYLDENTEKYAKTVERNRLNIEKRWGKSGTNEDTKNATGKSGTNEDTKNADNGFDSDSVFDSDLSSSTTIAHVHDDSLAMIQRHYEKYIGGLVSSAALSDIVDALNANVEPGLICKAIDIAVDANARKWAYVRPILNGWIVAGILTLESQITQEANRNANKSHALRPDAQQSKSAKQNRFVNFNQRENDYSQLEKLERKYLSKKLEQGGNSP